MAICPKCGTRVYSVCSNSYCSCHDGHDPIAELIWQEDGDSQKCPFCGFVALADFWEDTSIELFIALNGAKSLTEAVEKLKKLSNEN